VTGSGTLREGLGVGLIASLLWAVPASLRVDATVSTGLAFVGLVGAAALVLGPATALIGQVSLGRGTPGRAVLVGTLLCAAPLAVLGALLHAGTHHRPLGGVTFAVVGALILAAAVAIARRLPRVLGGRAASAGGAVLDGLAALSLVAAVALALVGSSAP
jgi:hypothetical protein